MNELVLFTHHGHARYGLVESTSAEGRMVTIVELNTGQRFARPYEEVELAADVVNVGDRVIYVEPSGEEHIGTVLQPELHVHFDEDHPEDNWLINAEEMTRLRKATEKDELRFADVVDGRAEEAGDVLSMQARIAELEDEVASLKSQLNNECERVDQLVQECAQHHITKDYGNE